MSTSLELFLNEKPGLREYVTEEYEKLLKEKAVLEKQQPNDCTQIAFLTGMLNQLLVVGYFLGCVQELLNIHQIIDSNL